MVSSVSLPVISSIRISKTTITSIIFAFWCIQNYIAMSITKEESPRNSLASISLKYIYNYIHTLCYICLMSMQLLFWAGNQSNYQNFDPSLLPNKIMTDPSHEVMRLQYGNRGCGIFKGGIQNQKGFCIRINIPKGNF